MDLKLLNPVDIGQNDPRFLDSIFNITIDPAILVLAGGLLILGFVIFGSFACAFYSEFFEIFFYKR